MRTPFNSSLMIEEFFYLSIYNNILNLLLKVVKFCEWLSFKIQLIWMFETAPPMYHNFLKFSYLWWQWIQRCWWFKICSRYHCYYFKNHFLIKLLIPITSRYNSQQTKPNNYINIFFDWQKMVSGRVILYY